MMIFVLPKIYWSGLTLIIDVRVQLLQELLAADNICTKGHSFFFEYSYARINVIVVNNSSRINHITIKSAVFTKQSKLEGPQ